MNQIIFTTVTISLFEIALARTFSVINNCPFTIWPAVFTDLTVGSATPDAPTGWEAAPFTSFTFSVPDNWTAGRIWGRRDCDFTVVQGPQSCLDGGCNGGLLCDPTTGTGVPPASLAEWTLNGTGNIDFYDTSLVNGYNLPLRITNDVECPIADCPVDLGPNCPPPLKGPFDATGFPVGCQSACQANLDGNQANSSNCCSGSFDTPATCPSSGVEFYSYFKNNCPNSYAYPFDESSGTALWKCDSSLRANYNLTFCPPPVDLSNAPGGAVSGTALPTDVPVESVISSSANDLSPTGVLSSKVTSATSFPSPSTTRSGSVGGRESILGTLRHMRWGVLVLLITTTVAEHL